MTLDELQRLCDEATPGEWVAKGPGYRGDGFSGYMDPCAELRIGAYDDEDPYVVDDLEEVDAQFIAAARTYLPKLIAVAKAAKRLSDNIAEFDTITDNCFIERLDDALASLEIT